MKLKDKKELLTHIDSYLLQMEYTLNQTYYDIDNIYFYINCIKEINEKLKGGL